MKILDRYLLRSFLSPLTACLSAFTMVYIIADLFNNLSDFIEGRTALGQVILFYLALVPVGLIYIAPVSLMLALLYCLSQMTKNNELTAIRACGVSTPRLMLPFIAVGIAGTLAVAAVNETISPRAAWWTRQFVRAQGADDQTSVYVATHVPYRNHAKHRNWLIGRFDTRNLSFREVEVVQSDAEGRDLFKIVADAAHWMDGRWWFRNAVYQEFDAFNYRKGPPRFEALREMPDWNETPQLFRDEIMDREYRSAYGLLKFLQNNRGISNEEVARVMVDIHSRLAMPFTCLMVTLIGIPFGYHTGRKGALMGTILAILLFFGYYVLINVGLWMGKNQLLAPWLAGWMPNLIFFGISLRLIARMR